jgi:hypothetical protein
MAVGNGESMPAKLTQRDLDDFERLLADPAESHFSAALVRLIKKADPQNRHRLARVYPEHVGAVVKFEIMGEGARLWRCGRCGHLNAVFPDFDPWPATCLSCCQRTEPQRMQNAKCKTQNEK